MRIRKRARRTALVAGLAAAIYTAAACRPAQEPAREKPVAPAFSLETLEGTSLALADLAGKTVVIDFWATWCAPCVYQIPVLNALHQSAGEDLAVLGVAVDADGAEAVGDFAEEHAIAYPVLLGDEALARRYGAPGFPALAVVDPAGRIDSLHVGVVDGQELEAAIAQARDGVPAQH